MNGSIKQSKPNEGNIARSVQATSTLEARRLSWSTRTRFVFEKTLMDQITAVSKYCDQMACCCNCGETAQVIVSQVCFNEVTMVEAKAEVPI